jgi:hypothetical protein
MTLCCDLADTMVVKVSHDEVPVPIHGDSYGNIELCNDAFTGLMTLLASAGQSVHMALWCDFADAMVATVSHNDVAAPINCDSRGTVELSNGRFSVSMAHFSSARQSSHMPL